MRGVRAAVAASRSTVVAWRKVRHGFIRAVAGRVAETRRRLNAAKRELRELESAGRVRLVQPVDDDNVVHLTRYGPGRGS